MPTAIQSPSAANSTAKSESKPYRMPRPDRGQRVLFHRNCIRNSATDAVAYVEDVSPSNVTLIVSGLLMESVPHESDPRVTQNPHIRENGMWDFNPSDKAIEERLTTLEAQMADVLK